MTTITCSEAPDRCAGCQRNRALEKTPYPNTDPTQQFSASEGLEDWGDAIGQAFGTLVDGPPMAIETVAAGAECSGSILEWVFCALGE